MKDVQCYEIFGGIALKNHAFSFSFAEINGKKEAIYKQAAFDKAALSKQALYTALCTTALN